jgi:type III secretion system YscQ/HrcQ family protein
VIATEQLSSVDTAFEFKDLDCYSRADLMLLNAFSRLCPDTPAWEAWLKDGLSNLLEVKTGTAIGLLQKNDLEQREASRYRFDKEQISIGRSPDNDVTLELRTIGKQHAHIFKRDDRFYLQDTGSAIGTFLNDKRLTPLEQVPLSDGDRFLVFPFSFVVELEDIWERKEGLEVWACSATPNSRDRFKETIPLNFSTFDIAVHPDAGRAVLAVDHAFLITAISRITRAEPGYLVDSDFGIIEFLLISILERLSQTLAFPFQFSLAAHAPTACPDQSGLSAEYVIGVPEATGAFRIFLPDDLLASIAASVRPSKRLSLFNYLTWLLSVTVGYGVLTASELAQLEPGDILLVANQLQILLPAFDVRLSERGWSGQQISDEPYQIQVQELLEGSQLMDEQISTDQEQSEVAADATPEEVTANVTPDLDSLPVKVHVILGQLEISLAELANLTAGTILELKRGKTDPVKLAVNGKVAGEGKLVEIEGKLGVRIVRWTTSGVMQ